MAYEPGGGTGEPFERREDLNYSPGYSIEDWIRNMMAQGNVGAAEPMGAKIPDFLMEQMRGRMQTPDLNVGPGGSLEDPQQFIQQMLAGDVVPHPGMSDLAQRRFTEPGVPQGAQGAASINQMGGQSSPYLDLLNILAFPSGRSMAPPIRR